MLTNTLITISLVVVTVVIHAIGFHLILRIVLGSGALTKSGLGFVTCFVTLLTCSLILLHMIEISVWGLFYFWWGCTPDIESSFYFSGASYTTAGFGDQLLAKPWRMLGPIESLTGILMCGLSTGLFFAIVSRWIRNWMLEQRALEPDLPNPDRK